MKIDNLRGTITITMTTEGAGYLVFVFHAAVLSAICLKSFKNQSKNTLLIRKTGLWRPSHNPLQTKYTLENFELKQLFDIYASSLGATNKQ